MEMNCNISASIFFTLPSLDCLIAYLKHGFEEARKNSVFKLISRNSQLNLMDAFSWNQLRINLFHDVGIVLIRSIFAFVAVSGSALIFNKISTRKLSDHQALEFIWTVVPAILLIVLALPSLRLLYLVDDIRRPRAVCKSIGHQWYWRYERLSGQQSFDSYITTRGCRNLDVDNGLVLNSNENTQIITTSADVIHSWAVPGLAIKIDAIPGRLNTIIFISNKAGVAYGQCSEICGANHSFIPIILEFL